ncbi:HAMP domain-containing sensor histidine kinase [Pseudovibrio sp. JE062]|uniref:HAMP domain-containing sensor histidine kinase n=1 Tax=Pseudovibrio sp. JE062 TaxID=439495 RepID=UPI000186F59C|nr:HAMP domain-containing sensor histidine kinase [Pseudovibrio sp. JE062]EEA93482.1 integral membrane sensor signal transduction histidine kinase [Pseudovibrio sp. JE062]
MIKSLKHLWQMSALRQAFALTLVFLGVLLATGLLADVSIRANLNQTIDNELLDKFDQIKTDLSRGATYQSIAGSYQSESEHFSVDEFISFKSDTGKIYGYPIPDLYGETGFINLAPYYFHEDEEDEESGEHVESETSWRAYVGRVPGGTLVVGASLRARNQLLNTLPYAFLFSGGVMMLITLSGGLWFGWRAQRRLSKITHALDQIAAGDLTTRIAPRDCKDDLDILSVKLDDTTQRLATTLQQVRDLSVNIAHDLKTPLTRLRAQLEQTQEQNLKGVSDAEGVAAALKKTDELLEVFDALLRISRIQSGERKKQFQPLKLDTLANEVAEIYQAVIEETGRTFSLEIKDATTIHADRVLLIQALANLIENALRHTPQDAKVTLFVSGNTMGLRDNGPGIPEEFYPRVLEPMFRMEKSRSTPGAGLGLALVKAIADLHQAELILSAPASGSGLSIEFVFANEQTGAN